MAKPIRIALNIDLQWPIKRHHEVYAGIQDYARQHAPDWALIPDLFPAQWIAPRGKMPAYDAVIGRIAPTVAKAARKQAIPIVNVWSNSPIRNEVPSVLTDYVEAGRMAGEHLVSRGLRRLAGVGYRRDVATTMYFQGLKEVARSRGIPLSLHLANFTDSDNENNWHRYTNNANAWINGWQLPVGVASSYDDHSRYLAMMCLRRGIQIPEQIAFIGANDEFLQCEGSEPTLSSIDMGKYRQGFLAAELLDKLLKGEPAPTEPIMAPPAELVARASTDVYQVADRTVARAMRFIAENCGRKIRIADVAAGVDCSLQKLERLFRQSGRRPINEEIVALRIELTKRLLIGSNDAIEDVAAKAGFGTAQHMRHVFRHQLKTTPTAFREKYQK
ncbi:MAG: substrate-binding domain-containing protein [Phycisphaeraceae bacterium]